MNCRAWGLSRWVFILWASSSLARAQVEEIYIARSVRETRVTPTDFCVAVKTGFNPLYEDRYSFRSMTTRSSDGRVTNADVKTIANAHACVGQKADPAVFTFYMEMQLGRTALTWTGECRQARNDFPEKGAGVMHCVMNLIDSHSLYVGGQLTTNTITSLNSLGTVTDPPGYTQASIATLRLWKQRKR